MPKHAAKIALVLIFLSAGLRAQVTEMARLMDSELKMTFPSIYFKNNSTDYAAMPYTADSCFKYIAQCVKEINSYVIWRDSSEPEQLTNKRIKKLKAGLKKYTPSRKITICTMGEAQKVSRETIAKGSNHKQTQYLLSLNSVFDISAVKARKKKKTHWCVLCFVQGKCPPFKKK